MTSKFQCVIHGSFSKHFNEIRQVRQLFVSAGIEVLAPKDGELIDSQSGFARFEDEADKDPRLIELLYLHNLKNLGSNGFSYFVNPDGYIGRSTSYELGIAQLTNTPCFFMHKLVDHPAYLHSQSVWSPQLLVDYLRSHYSLPEPHFKKDDRAIHSLWQKLVAPSSVVATGAIIEYQPRNSQVEKEVLLVKTHKWEDRFSIVGGRVKSQELLHQALLREVKEETNLKGEVGSHICTFDQIKNSGYYRTGVQHIFVDNVVRVRSKKVVLNHEAEDYEWALPSEALKHLDIEPNAKTTLEHYINQLSKPKVI